mgnify:CR=1 FL=1
MGKTDNLRKQHEEMVSIVSRMSAILNRERLSKDATEMRSLLSQLAGKVSVHLAMEDKALYPHLLEHSNEIVKNMARNYMAEMGDIGNTFKGYIKKWPDPVSIQQDSDLFIKETKTVIDVLSKRIDKENRELYHTVDTLT